MNPTPRIFLIFLLMLFLAAAGCKKKDVYKIGISQCSEDDWRIKMNEEIEREVLLHDDVEVEIRSADDSSNKQIADLDYFLNNDFDIIIVAPNEADALTPKIKEIYESGKPVILFDRDINGEFYTARIGADNEGLGKLAAHYGVHITGGGAKAIELRGLPGSSPAVGRHIGFKEEFEKEGGTIVASEPANWNQKDAEHKMDSLLRIYPDVELIYAHNDRMAIGASESVRRKGLTGIKIIGIDAAPAIGIKAVADSVINATFLYPTEGHRIIQTALTILKNEPYERVTILPVSSAVDNSNADILLLQNENIIEETHKMEILKSHLDEYWTRHNSQTILFYACIVIIVLLLVLALLITWDYWKNKKHHRTLLEQNRLLEEERDKQKSLNEQLESATQSKLMFFTNISHDLRTPLTLIAVPVTQLLEASNLTPQQHNLMKIADKNVRILQRLLNQILDFRKYENGKLDLRLREVEINKLLDDWMESFNAVAWKRNIKLSLETPDRPVRLAIDSEKVERVFFNLLSNAFNHTADNGSIAVKATLTNDDATLMITVADTGTGIPKEEIASIFDRFYQVERVKPKGSGIGLTVAKAFIELHGGTIFVESEVHKGTCFTVTLPVRHVSEEAEPVAHTIDKMDVSAELEPIETEIEYDSEKPLALVIDDNGDIRKMLSELLNGDYNVITAKDGKEGLSRAARYVPDVVICDVMMPEMDGMECCRRLKNDEQTSHIPVLLLTASSMDEARIEGYDNGADGYISKPFNADVLKARIDSLIKNRKRIREVLGEDKFSIKSPTVADDSRKVLPKGDIDNEFYQRFMKIFREELGNPELNVDRIAGLMGFERSQLYRKIKALTNYAPVELIRQLRLKEARRQLLSTDRSISEIAYSCGFSTPAYFTKCYRQTYSETPSETRSRMTKK